ncbi:MAG: SDR family NAD(P)-dependent oxidoreductase [Deltaproteobacteria bacterium]|nr:SDR family NAD(P)-dependent oxidoreductase [Deltaproteobacteria bacterium]
MIVITGAGGGIGAAFARCASNDGAALVLVGRRRENLERVAQALPSDRVMVCVADVADYSSLVRSREEILAKKGHVDILVNNAAVGYGGRLTDLSAEEIEYSTKVNLVGPMWLTHMFLPLLRERSEAMLVNVVSLSGYLAMPFQSVYAAGKFGLRGFSESMSRELKGSNVHVLTAYPAAIDTEMNTPEMRARCLELGTRVSAIPASTAATQLVRAIERNRSMVVLGSASDRLAPMIARFAPRIVDKLAEKMSPAMSEFARLSTDWARHQRRSLPPRAGSVAKEL